MSAWSTASTFIATVYSPHKSQPNAFKEQSKLCHSSAQNASGTSLIMQNNSEASKALILFQKDQYTVPPPLLLLTSTCFLHSSSFTHFLLLLVHPSQMPQGVRLPRPRLATTLLPQRSAWLTGPPHLNLCSEITWPALTNVAQFVGHCSAKQKGTCLCCGFGSCWGAPNNWWEATNQCFSPSLSPSLPSL